MGKFADTDTVFLSEPDETLAIIDQTKLPGEFVVLRLCERTEIFEAISSLRVRGAPAIGVAAAIAMYVLARRYDTREPAVFRQLFEADRAYLASSRPTAVNLFWALGRMGRVLGANTDADCGTLVRLLRGEALAVWQEDIDVCRRLGEYGLTLLRDGDGILTHCNAGRLAAVRYGTALAPIHLGRERGMRFHVFTDETRPLLQGARLSAFELHEAGVQTTVLCDNMASSAMKNGWIQAVIVGCDRVAANGDAANKIGTSGVAVLAKHYGIPFYVAAPSSTVDPSCPDGGEIPIEQRDPREITELWYQKRMAPDGVDCYNPAFDVTDHSLITAIITEYGIARPPFRQAFEEFGILKKRSKAIALSSGKERRLSEF